MRKGFKIIAVIMTAFMLIGSMPIANVYADGDAYERNVIGESCPYCLEAGEGEVIHEEGVLCYNRPLLEEVQDVPHFRVFAANPTQVSDFECLKTEISNNTSKIEIIATIEVAEDMTIPEGITISRGNGFFENIFHITKDATLTIDGATFNATGDQSQVYTGSIFYVDPGASLIIEDGSFYGNTTSTPGGAINNHGTTIVKGGSFNANTTTNNGGAIYNEGNLRIGYAAFSNNRAVQSSNWGGAIYDQYQWGSTFTIDCGDFFANYAKNHGGAIYSGHDLDLGHTSFRLNKAGLSNESDKSKKSDGIYASSGLSFSGKNYTLTQEIYVTGTIMNNAELLTIDAPICASSWSSPDFSNTKSVIINSRVSVGSINTKGSVEISADGELAVSSNLTGELTNNGKLLILYSGQLSSNIYGSGNIVYLSPGYLVFDTRTTNRIIIANGHLMTSLEGAEVKDITLQGGTYLIEGVSAQEEQIVQGDVKYIKTDSINGMGTVQVRTTDWEKAQENKFYYFGTYPSIGAGCNITLTNGYGNNLSLPTGYGKKFIDDENGNQFIKIENVNLFGTVYEADGSTPVSNAEISIGNQKVKTDEEGKYVINQFDSTLTEIQLTVDGRAIERKAFSVNEKKGINFVLPQRYSISGNVKNGLDDSPAVGVTVSVGSSAGTTDNAGDYSLINVIGGNISVVPSKNNSAFSPSGKTINLDKNKNNIDFILYDGASLGDKWTDDNGISIYHYDKIYYDKLLNDTDGFYTANSSFDIDTPEKLAAIAKLVNTTSIDFFQKTIILAQDIDLAKYQWDPIGLNENNSFRGSFDGQGHRIKNLTIGRESIPALYSSAGLFGYVENVRTDVEIKNATLENTNINAQSGAIKKNNRGVGSLVGYANGKVLITDISAEGGNIKTDKDGHGSSNAGGLIGYINNFNSDLIEIKNCSSKIDMEATGNYVGGMAGYLSDITTLENCSAKGNVNGREYTGGLIGFAYSYHISEVAIINCSATGNVSGSYQVGGLVGSTNNDKSSLKVTMANCYATGNVTGNILVGGLLGNTKNVKEIENCYARGNVTGIPMGITVNRIGGLIGGSDTVGSIENCYATGDVVGEQQVGGFAGVVGSSKVVKNCYSVGNVKSTTLWGNSNTGGFIGELYDHLSITTEVKGCIATGTVFNGSNQELSSFIGTLSGTFDMIAEHNFYSKIGKNPINRKDYTVKINGTEDPNSIARSIIKANYEIEKGKVELSLEPNFKSLGADGSFNAEESAAYTLSGENSSYSAILNQGNQSALVLVDITQISFPSIPSTDENDEAIAFPEGFVAKAPDQKNVKTKAGIIKGIIDFRNETLTFPALPNLTKAGNQGTFTGEDCIFDISKDMGLTMDFKSDTLSFPYKIPSRPAAPKGLAITKSTDGKYLHIKNLEINKDCEYSLDGGQNYTPVTVNKDGLIIIPTLGFKDEEIGNIRIRYGATDTTFRSVAYGDTIPGENPEIPVITPQDPDAANIEVRFYQNDGSPDFNLQFVKENSTVTQPSDPQREYYSFKGWYKDSDCLEEDKWDFSTPITSNTNLYAKWERGQANLRVTLLKPENLIYNKQPKSLGVDPHGLPLISKDYRIQYIDEKGTSTYIPPTGAGSYQAKFELTDLGQKKYILDEVLPITFTIRPKEVDVYWDGYWNRVYDGEESNVTVYLYDGVEEGDECQPIIEGGKEKGSINESKTYKAVLTGFSNLNYVPRSEELTKKYTILPKEAKPDIEDGSDVKNVKINCDLTNIYDDDTVFTEEDKEIIDNNGAIWFNLKVKALEENLVPAQDKAAVVNELKNNKIGMYLDATLFKVIKEFNKPEREDKIKQTADKTLIVIPIPEQLRGKSSYGVLRVHHYQNTEGEDLTQVDLLEDKDKDPNTITIETDRFSTYALVYNQAAGGNGNDGGSGTGGGGSSSGSGSSNSSYLSTPSYSVKSGTIVKNTPITITHQIKDAKIYYTLDGTQPTVNSTLYSNPIVVNKDMMIKAIAEVNGKVSSVEGVNYTIRSAKISFKQNVKDIRYIKAYADNTFKPNQVITRYEMIESLNHLLDIEKVPANPLSDVAKGYQDIVMVFQGAGIIDGFTDGTFKGDQGLTRAEFVKIMSVVLNVKLQNGKSSFPDGRNHWSEEYIAEFTKLSYVKGYEDGLFKPDRLMTRAEFTAIVNRIIKVETQNVPQVFSDLNQKHWCYQNIMRVYIK